MWCIPFVINQKPKLWKPCAFVFEIWMKMKTRLLPDDSLRTRACVRALRRNCRWHRFTNRSGFDRKQFAPAFYVSCYSREKDVPTYLCNVHFICKYSGSQSVSQSVGHTCGGPPYSRKLNVAHILLLHYHHFCYCMPLFRHWAVGCVCVRVLISLADHICTNSNKNVNSGQVIHEHLKKYY